MPVHVDHCDREWKVLFFKPFHQSFVGIFRVFVIAAPPVAQSVSGNHGCFPAQMAEVFQCLMVIVAVSPEIDVCASFPAGLHPSVFAERQRTAVIHHRKAVPAYDAVFQRDGSVCFVQSAGGSAQIPEIISVMPDAVVGTVIPDGLYGQTIG